MRNTHRLIDSHHPNAKPLTILYATGFLISAIFGLGSYYLSTFLVDNNIPINVGIIFSASAFLALIGTSNMPRLLKKFGNFKVSIMNSLILTLSLVFLSISRDPILILIFFFLFTAISNMLYISSDEYVEFYSSKSEMGHSRGTYLTMVNMALLAVAFIGGYVGQYYGIPTIFLISAFLSLGLAFVYLSSFKTFKDPKYNTDHIFKITKSVFKNRVLRPAYILNFSLMSFYSVLTIFMPLYLGKVIGFSLAEIGLIFALMHTAFLILEIPIGTLIDKGISEVYIIVLGFVIFGTFTFIFSITQSTFLFAWILLHFVSRLGASMIETGVETHFFRNIDAADSSAMSLFRNTSTLAFLVAPLVASVLFAIGSYALVFQGLSVLAILSIWATMNIKHYGDKIK